jgi:hypothetical protein
MLWQCRKYFEQNVMIALYFFGIFSVIISTFFYGRPQIFGYFFLFAELKILYVYWEKDRTKWIWILPVISIWWSNFHGGSSNMAYFLPIIFIVAEIFPFSIGKIQTEKKTKRWRIQLIVVTFLCAAALMVNPIGIKILTFPYTTLSDSVSMSFISEWAAPDAKNVGQLLLFWIPIVLLMFGLWAEEKKIRLIDLLVAGFFLFLFLRSQRFIILWFIAAAFSLMRYLPRFEIKELRTKIDKIAVILAEVVLCGGFLYSAVEMGYRVQQLPHVISVNLSNEMEAYIINDDPQRIFNDYNFGEDLIRMGVPVFVDARADMYIGSDHLLENAVSLITLIQVNSDAKTEYVDVVSLFQEYQFDRVLIQKDRALYAYMLGNPNQFDVLYEDDTSAYLAVK